MRTINKNNLTVYLIRKVILILLIVRSNELHSQSSPSISCNPSQCISDATNVKENDCFGHILIPVSAFDDLTKEEDLLYEYKIDLNNDGLGKYSGYEYYSSQLSKKQKNQGSVPAEFFNPFADNPNCSYNADGIYPMGIHKILWTVYDELGNKDQCSLIFEVMDCKPPEIKCKKGFPEQWFISSNGCVTIDLRNLIDFRYDNCTDTQKLKLYTVETPKESKVSFCCDDIILHGGGNCESANIPLTIWVKDENNNVNSCLTHVYIEDRLDICPSDCFELFEINGESRTITGEVINPVQIQLYENSNLINETYNGSYNFNYLRGSTTYLIKPSRNDDHINGVSTLDISLIQKHILGKIKIINPFSLLSADVNNNGSITSADISEIRKLILGSISEFTKVKSWGFVPKDFLFQDSTSPWKAPSLDTIEFKTKGETRVLDFIGYKLGDVSNNARASNLQEVKSRTSSLITNLIIEDEKLIPNQDLVVKIRIENETSLEGLQFTIKFDPEILYFQEIQSGQLEMNEENYSINRMNEGLISFLWNSIKPIDLKKIQELFTIKFHTIQKGILSECISFVNSPTPAEAFIGEKLFDIGLRFIHNSEPINFKIIPNVIEDKAIIRFYSPKIKSGQMKIFNIQGKLLLDRRLFATEGMNEIEIDKKDLQLPGIYYLSIEFNKNTAFEKFLLK